VGEPVRHGIRTDHEPERDPGQSTAAITRTGMRTLSIVFMLTTSVVVIPENKELRCDPGCRTTTFPENRHPPRSHRPGGGTHRNRERLPVHLNRQVWFRKNSPAGIFRSHGPHPIPESIPAALASASLEDFRTATRKPEIGTGIALPAPQMSW
jgi:hypothetical protein